MPFSEYLSFIETRLDETPIKSYDYGFQNSLLSEIENILETVEDDELTRHILQTGPCPNNSRIYFTLTKSKNLPNPSLSKFLQEPVNISHREAGKYLEELIDKANIAMNSWLEEDNSQIQLNQVPKPVQDKYETETEVLSKKFDTTSEIDSEDLYMNVQYSIEANVFSGGSPDGIWRNSSVPGGVFESKVTPPPDPIDKRELGSYAIQLEEESGKPFEFGVYLAWDEEEDSIYTYSFEINQDIRSQIEENLQKFSSLFTEIYLFDDDEKSLTSSASKPFEPSFQTVCRKCPFIQPCRFEGRHWEQLNGISPNMKLSGERIVEILPSISEAEPNRRDVDKKIMSRFFPDKSKKSIMRGMVSPTLHEFGLIRRNSGEGILKLCPDARIACTENKLEQLLNKFVRDYCVFELHLPKEAISFFLALEDELHSEKQKKLDNDEENPTLKIRRFYRQYLDFFDISLLSEQDLYAPPTYDKLQSERQLVARLYPQVSSYLKDEQQLLDLVRSLNRNKIIPIDVAREYLIKDINNEDDIIVSHWFVDELMWQANQLSDKIEMWKGGLRAKSGLIRDNTYYDSIVIYD